MRLYEIIYNTFEKFIPSTSIRSSNRPKWYNKELASLKNTRNKTFKKLCSHRENFGEAHTSLDEQFQIARVKYESYRKQRFSDYLRN